MDKLSHFSGHGKFGATAIPIFTKSDAALEKVASSELLPDVVKYIENLRPNNNSQYVLVNALGASEYYSSNINGDAFTEASLVHLPDRWTGIPAIDKVVSKNWPYGFPTFYNAHPFAHHRNKNSSKAFGEIELATWHPRMKRVELVVRVDHDKCTQFGGTGVWDRLRIGDHPDVSMGTRVPFDTCVICLDWPLYREALSTFDPKRHVHPGQAALQFHKQLKAKNGVGIRGLSVTRNDYCDHAKTQMSRIYPDGRKVWVYNDFPRFFDISFVFIGADKTAKVMLFIFRNGKVYSAKPSVEVAEEVGVREGTDQLEKAASIDEELLKRAFGKLAKPKSAEINKDVVPSQFAGKAIPLLTRKEPDIPKDLLNNISNLPLKNVLSTTAGMGIVLRPREFQRITIIQLGHRPLADELDSKGIVFSKSDQEEPMEMGADHFMPSLARILLPLMAIRSALGPIIEKRITMISAPEEKIASPTSHISELLGKIGSAYNGYRRGVMELVANTQELIGRDTASAELCKLANAPVDEIFTPLSVAYLQDSFMDEFGVIDKGVVKLGNDQRGEGLPLVEHGSN